MSNPTEQFREAVESALLAAREGELHKRYKTGRPEMSVAEALASIQAATVEFFTRLVGEDDDVTDMKNFNGKSEHRNELRRELRTKIDQLIKGFKMSAHKHQWQLDRIYYDTLAGPYLSSPPKHADFVCECGAYKRQLIKDLSNE